MLEGMKSLLEQAVETFVSEGKRGSAPEGYARRLADCAEKLAREAGKDEGACEAVYYFALLFACSRISYDGSDDPNGLKEDAIPELARLIAVSDAYVSLTSKDRPGGAMTYNNMREELITQAGMRYDPMLARKLVTMMDLGKVHGDQEEELSLERELTCRGYRENISLGIPVTDEITEIHFRCESLEAEGSSFSMPSIILFDSFDSHVHNDKESIEKNRYLEYAEAWFDGHLVSTGVRNSEVSVSEAEAYPDNVYGITAGKYEDRMKVELRSGKVKAELIFALPDNSKAAFIGLTGENCRLKVIEVSRTGEKVGKGSIKRIVDALSYTDRLESDIPNVQIDRFRSECTEGIPIEDFLQIDFHFLSLPGANLVWHCPHIVIFSSENGRTDGEGYLEYAYIKLNGEMSGEVDSVKNSFFMKKQENFPGWDAWKELCKKGLECSVSIKRSGNTIMLATENLGIALENTSTFPEIPKNLYVAITGDQVALTDIRIVR